MFKPFFPYMDSSMFGITSIILIHVLVTSWFCFSDDFFQERRSNVDSIKVSILNKFVRNTFTFEPYLETTVSRNLRTASIDISTSGHSLRMHNGSLEIEWKGYRGVVKSDKLMKLKVNSIMFIDIYSSLWSRIHECHWRSRSFTGQNS